MSENKHSDGEPRDLDLSSLNFEQFAEFFFNRKVVSNEEQYAYFLTDLRGETYFDSSPASPEVLVNHLTMLFTHFAQIATKYRLAQVDQGIWGILGPPLSLNEFLFNPPTHLAARQSCIRSMYHVYSDYVAGLQIEPDPEVETGFYMWWDLVLHGFWDSSRPVVPGTWRGDPSKLDPESSALLDVLFETLTQILAIPNRPSQLAALHGLGHLYHPGVSDIVQRFIDSNPPGFDVKWLEQCRDCEAM
jgi:hypothetical protein